MTKRYRTLNDVDIAGKRVLLRAGFDVPIENGEVVDTERIEAVLPTIEEILKKGGSVILMSHQGRPKGKRNMDFTQKPLVKPLENLLKKPVKFAESCVGAETEKTAKSLKPGEILLLENLRFEPGEEANDETLAKNLAALADVYVNDAFTNCHRTHASMVGVPRLLPSCMGLQLEQEVTHLSKATEDPKRPLVLIISGAKIETKLPVIEFFLKKGDDILLGGAIANTFVAAAGHDVGKSKYEADFVAKGKELLAAAGKHSARIHVPVDAVCAEEIAENAQKRNLRIESAGGNLRMLDVGSATIETYVNAIQKASTIIWNGPVGLYEMQPFAEGTKRVAEAVSLATKRGATTIIGGGDTIDFHRRYGMPLDAYTFVSTGGGAMLEFVAGKTFQSLEVLKA